MSRLDLLVHSEQSRRLTSLHGVRVREDTLYSNHRGEEKKGIRQRAEKAIEKLQEVFRKALGPEEAVLYVARCQAPVSTLDQLTLGWYIYYVTGTLLVFTNRRLLHFDVKRNGDWKQTLRTVSWGDVEEARAKGWLGAVLELKYRNGKKEKYWNLRREDAKKINILLSAIKSAGARETRPSQTMVSLCPSCLAELIPAVYRCAQCGVVFKDEKTMLRRSLLIPGGGYFYTGHWFLGFGDLLLEAYLLVLLVVVLGFALGFLEDTSANPAEPSLAGGEAWIAVAFVAVILVLEKLLTIHHCRRFVREFIPLGQGPSQKGFSG
jgi:hypothetical protein